MGRVCIPYRYVFFGWGHVLKCGVGMAVTPEGKVKYKLVKFLNSLEPRPYMFFPATGGYGRSGVPDVVGCWKGRMFAIECKAEGKGGSVTALQHRELQKINEAGGVAFIYDGSILDIDMEAILKGG